MIEPDGARSRKGMVMPPLGDSRDDASFKITGEEGDPTGSSNAPARVSCKIPSTKCKGD